MTVSNLGRLVTMPIRRRSLAESLGWWQRRLGRLQVQAEHPVDRDGEEVLTLRDPDGLVIDLVASPGNTRSEVESVSLYDEG